MYEFSFQKVTENYNAPFKLLAINTKMLKIELFLLANFRFSGSYDDFAYLFIVYLFCYFTFVYVH